MKWFLGLFVLALTASLTTAQQPARLDAALRQTVTLEFDNLTLDQCAERLRTLTKLQVIVHESLRPLVAARDEKLAAELPGDLAPTPMPSESSQVQQPRGFSCTLRQLPLGTALRTFLGHYGLGYAVVNESIVIATADKARHIGREQPATLHFDNVPLTRALGDFSSRYGIDVMLDRHALKDAMTPITLMAREVSVDEALQLLADCVNLQAAPLSSGWILTTADKARAWQARARQRAEAAKAQTITYPPGDSGAGLVSGFGFSGGGLGGAGFGGGAAGGFSEPVAIPRAFLQTAGPPPRFGQAADKAPSAPAKTAPVKKSLAADTLKKMNEPSDVVIQDPITLKEAIQVMHDHGFPPIVLHLQVFKADNPEAGDLFESPIRWPQVKGLPRGKVLQLILEQLPAGNANFLVKPGYVLVTTNDAMHANGQFVRGANFVRIPLDEALHELSELSGISVVLDPRAGDKAKTPIMARFPAETNVAQIARVLADMADLKAVRVDSILYVTTRGNPTVFPTEAPSSGRYTIREIVE